MNSILVPVDLSDSTPRVLRAAEEMAVAFRCKVHVLHVFNHEVMVAGNEFGVAPAASEIIDDELRTRRAELETVTRQLCDRGVDASAVMVEGGPVECIADEARRLSADLIIVGSHGHGALYHLLLGSVTTGVLRSVHCPVVVVPVRAARRTAQAV